MNQLANVFFQNWVKAPCDVLDLSADDSFAPAMEQLRCEVRRLDLRAAGDDASGGTPKAVSVIGGFERLNRTEAAAVLANISKAMDPEGILFIRMKDNENGWNLFSFLEILDLQPTFRVAETYTMGADRDYLLRPTKTRPTVCIGMIAKNEERDLPRCLQSLEGVADGIVLLDTGSVDNTMEVARAWALRQLERYPKFHHEVRTYLGASEQDENGDWKLWNFSKARNEYVLRIESLQFDYTLWMDADDEVLDPHKLKLSRYLDQYDAQGVMIEAGSLRWPHYRLLKRHKVRFAGWCHEYPSWFGASCVHDDITIRHDGAPGIGEDSNDRNLRILEREMAASPNSRTAFYLGNTYKDRGQAAQAISLYQARMDFGKGYEDEYWFAALYKARCERMNGQPDQCRQSILAALTERPDWAEFWMELCYLEAEQGNHDRAIGWALQAKDRPIVATQLWRERDKYTDQPYRMIAHSNERKGDLGQALHWGTLARDKIGQHDQEWEDWLNNIRTRQRRKRVVWHRPGALGDVLMTLNLVGLYKQKNPDTEVVYQAHRSVVNLLEPVMRAAGVDRVVDTDTQVAHDKAYNLVGYPIHEGYPEKPMSKHLIEYFSEEVGLAGEVAALKLKRAQPKVEGDYLTLHVKPGWSPYKQWSLDHWEWVAQKCRESGIPVVQIGAKDDPRIESAENFLGLSFEESLGMIGNAKVHAGIDSWSNHATNIEWDGKGKTPGVILWGSTQATAAGYSHNINISKQLPCQPCFKEDPKISSQPRGSCEHHSCMKLIHKEEVLKAIVEKWRASA